MRRLGHGRLPEIVEALAAAVERGHHVAAVAAEGSGREALYALAALERCDPGVESVQTLALASTRETAGHLALAAREAAAGAGLRAVAIREGARLGVPGPVPHFVAGRPGPLLAEVRAGRLGLTGLRLFVVDGAATLDALGSWPSVEALLDTLPDETQRIVVSDRLEGRLEDLLLRQLPRARRWPLELFEPSEGAAAANAPPSPLLCGAAAVRSRRLDLLEAAVRAALGPDRSGAAVVRAADPEEAARLAAVLETRGLPAALGDDGAVRLGEADDPTALLYGTPDGLPALEEALGQAERRAVILPSRHLRHLELLATRAGWPLRTLGTARESEVLEPIGLFREQIRERLEGGGDDAELLVLEPLLEEFGAERVAAALSGLLRRGRDERPQLRPWPDMEAASGLGPPGAPALAPERGVRPAWTRLWIGVGKRDGVRPADLVGAITGETGIVGGQIGKIEIRTGYSLVDVDSQVVERVIRGLSGKVIRGREATVRLDRGG